MRSVVEKLPLLLFHLLKIVILLLLEVLFLVIGAVVRRRCVEWLLEVTWRRRRGAAIKEASHEMLTTAAVAAGRRSAIAWRRGEQRLQQTWRCLVIGGCHLVAVAETTRVTSERSDDGGVGSWRGAR